MSGGGDSGGGSSSNTTNTIQEVPQYVQEESKANQALANSLASQPYPKYQGQLIQPFTDLQNAGVQGVANTAYSYAPWLQSAMNVAGSVNPSAADPYLTGAGNEVAGANANLGAASGAYANAQNLTNPNSVYNYMSPYIQASLAPQLSDLNIANAQQQQQINLQAAQAGAFGDSRQGVAQGMQNYATDQSINQLTGTAYQNAFNAANQALGQAQNAQLQAGSGYTNAAGQYGSLGSLYNQMGGTALNEQTLGLNQAQQMAALAQQNQTQGLAGANALFQAGGAQQSQLQTELNTAYQQYLNQVNWPYQQLNVRESAIANSPYNIATATTLPAASTTAQGFGTVAQMAGMIGGSPAAPKVGA